MDTQHPSAASDAPGGIVHAVLTSDVIDPAPRHPAT